MRLAHNPSLDGLRAFAIFLVLACHTGRLPGGWVGVDVFFVLSGYLITSILTRELRDTGAIDLWAFYRRRAFRLLPPLGVLVAFQLARAALSANGAQIREATLVGALYLENWNNVFRFAPFDLMGHTWSLAVEEQFYMLWPLLLPLVVLRGFWWVLAGAAAMVVARCVCWRAGLAETTLDFSMLLRPVGLLVGCSLAFAPRGLPAWAGYIGLACVAAVAALVALPAVYALAPVLTALSTAAVICASPSALGWAPLAYIGRISYGLYLYHWPIFMLGEKYKPAGAGHAWAIGLLVVVVVVAAASYEFIERPVLRWGRGG